MNNDIFLLGSVPIKASNPLDPLDQEIDANLESNESIDELLNHLRLSVPEIRFVNTREDENWLERVSKGSVFNYTYAFGRFCESINPTLGLEALGVEYFGSTPAGLYLSANKVYASQVMGSLGFSVPKELLICERLSKQRAEQVCVYFYKHDLLVLKPAFEESSIGLRPVENSPQHIQTAVDSLIERLRQPIIVQEYVEGTDVTVPMIGRIVPQVLPPLMLSGTDNENIPFVFTAELKATKKSLQYIQLEADERLFKNILGMAVKSFELMHQRDYSRLDCRLTSSGECYFFEVNANPQLGLRDNSFSVSAALCGLELRHIVAAIIGRTRLDLNTEKYAAY